MFLKGSIFWPFVLSRWNVWLDFDVTAFSSTDFYVFISRNVCHFIHPSLTELSWSELRKREVEERKRKENLNYNPSNHTLRKMMKENFQRFTYQSGQKNDRISQSDFGDRNVKICVWFWVWKSLTNSKKIWW